jgi:hypothetical protein
MEFRRQKTESRIQEPEEIMRPRATSFEDLVVWQKAHQFVLAVYGLSRAFPKYEIYG